MNKTITATLVFALLALAVMAVRSSSSGSPATLTPSSADAYVRSDQPDANFGSTWDILVMGPSLDTLGFVKFDLSSIPYGVTIVSADLKLNAALNNGGDTVEVYRVLTDWNESTITWNNRPTIANFYTETKSGLHNGYVVWNVKNDLQSFVSASANNYGWCLKGHSGWISFHSRDNPPPFDTYPMLEVTYIPTSDSWPMLHHDPMHTGCSTSTSPKTNQTVWTFQIGSYLDRSLAVSDDIVYIGAQNGKLYALNATNGEHIWNYTMSDYVSSCPAISEGIVCAGSADGYVYALNATDGAFLWSYFTTAHWYFSSPAIADGVVYIGSFDNNIYALNLTTGAYVWSYTTSDHVYSSPAVVGGVVYVGSSDYSIYALNASNGAFMWNYQTNSSIGISSPAVVGGFVYVGSNDGNVYALNATTGALVWFYKTGGWVYSSLAVVDGITYFGSIDGKIYALNAATGAFKWSYTTGDRVASSPAVADGIIYVGSNDHSFYALNATNGAPVWSYQTGDAIFSSPAVVDGIVYIGSDDGKVYAFGFSPTIPEFPIFALLPLLVTVTLMAVAICKKNPSKPNTR